MLTVVVMLIAYKLVRGTEKRDIPVGDNLLFVSGLQTENKRTHVLVPT